MKLLLLVLPSFFNLSMSYAADKISWEAGVLEASSANSELSAAKSSLQSSQYQINVARSGFFPTVSASTGYSYDSTNAPKSYSLLVNANENLFSGFSDSSKVSQAKFNRSSSEASLESVKAKVSFDLKSAFMGLVYSQKFIALTEDIIKRREANLKLVQLRFENGRENIGSLHLSKAYLAQAKYDHLQAINSLEVYQAQLAKVLGREDYLNLEVDGAVPIMAPPYENSRMINYKDLVKDIPDYKKAYFDEQSAKASIDISKSSFYPSLNLTQSAGRTGRESNSPLNTWIIGASLTFPLFSGGKDYYSYKSASENYRTSAFRRISTEESSVANLKDAYTKYVEAVMKLEVDDAFVLAASSRERIAKAQYNNGLITFIDWDTIENDLINRQKSLLQSQRDRVVAEAAWEQVQGRGVIP
ncbi:MAG: TolC family protein [Bacteriovorax sp.]